jgi:hypothetical protein
MSTAFRFLAIAIFSFSAPFGSAIAATDQVQFSADTLQKGPQGSESQGKIYVGNKKMRTEMTQGGQQIVQITDNQRQIQWILYPAQRSYMEYRVPAGAPQGDAQGSDRNPCQGMQGASCRNLGQEQVAGRQAVKWEITISHQGKSQKSTRWIDSERGIPLRQEMPNGQRMELRMLGRESLGGRAVEKWEMSMYQGDQSPKRSLQWYDPELKLTVREEFPGGYVRGMQNIRVGAQPAQLFTVPMGFKKITPQQQQHQGRQR